MKQEAEVTAAAQEQAKLFQTMLDAFGGDMEAVGDLIEGNHVSPDVIEVMYGKGTLDIFSLEDEVSSMQFTTSGKFDIVHGAVHVRQFRYCFPGPYNIVVSDNFNGNLTITGANDDGEHVAWLQVKARRAVAPTFTPVCCRGGSLVSRKLRGGSYHD